MENFIALVFDVLTLLTDSYKIYLKNGRIMAFLALIIISLHSMLYLFNAFYVTPCFFDMMMKQSYELFAASSGRPAPEFSNLVKSLQLDLNLFLLVEWVFLLITAISSLLFAISTTYASALIHGATNISINDLASTTFRSIKRPLVTSFYITLFVFGYFLLSIVILLPPAMYLIGDRLMDSKVFAILFAIPVTIFYTYISVVWYLSLVISILEEKYGIEALGKAAQIVKGMKLQGFTLNVFLTIVSLTLSLCLELLKPKQSQVVQIAISFVFVSSLLMVKMFWYTAYTVLYYGCKKNHGEEVELQSADIETIYFKVPTAPLINENIP